MNLDHVQIMGILNVTPDSFSDGGNLTDAQKIKDVAQKMIENGASILDIGGEASGPGSTDVSLKEELNRVLPALAAIKDLKTTISIDTHKAEVADQALQNGAQIINDITGLRGDPKMAEVIAKHQAKVVIMYSKDNTPRTSKENTQYEDVIATIKNFFDQQISLAQKAGINKNNIILDPGMGAFVSADSKYSYEILDRLPELKSCNLPILVGTSKKSMHPFPLEERLIPSIATGLYAALQGADIIRVHDVNEHRLALRTFQS